jgi:histidinol-phosphate aminotransferase
MSNTDDSLKRPVHGSITPAELRELGLNIDDVIDFSSNINPLGMPSNFKNVISDTDISRYPDPDCLELREAISRKTGADTSSILIGNGSTELIHLIARSFLNKNGDAVILSPTYGEYETACRLAGTKPVFIKAQEKNDYRWNIPSACREIEAAAPRIVFLCNPNNPTGVLLKSSDVAKIAAAAAPGLLMVDEAYMPFADDPWDATSLLDKGNIMVMRSMTKDYALAGIRLGYLIAAPDVIERIKCLQPFWSVNSIAQELGLAAIDDRKHIARARKVVSEARSHLLESIEETGLDVIPTSTNFMLIKVGNAKTVRRSLLKRGVCVRDCTSFGLPQYIRVAMQPVPACRKLVNSLREILTEKDI